MSELAKIVLTSFATSKSASSCPFLLYNLDTFAAVSDFNVFIMIVDVEASVEGPVVLSLISVGAGPNASKSDPLLSRCVVSAGFLVT